MGPNNGQRSALADGQIVAEAKLNAEYELRTRLCVADINSALEKYGLILGFREVRVNGQVVETSMALTPRPQTGGNGAAGPK